MGGIKIDKETKRIEILQAAVRVFYMKGFEGTKIVDIAKEAGIGKGTVYEYFDSKKQLFEQMVAYNCEVQGNRIKEILEKGSSLEEKIINLAKYQTKLVQKNIKIFNVIACSKIMAREIGAFFMEQNIRTGEIVKRQVEEAIGKGEVRADTDPEIASAIIMGTIMQYFGSKVVFANISPEENDYTKVADAVLSGIGRT